MHYEASSGHSPSQRVMRIASEQRRKEKELMFASMRKRMMKDAVESQSDDEKEISRQRVAELVRQLEGPSTEFHQKMFLCWDECHTHGFRFLTERHIEILVGHLETLYLQSSDSAKRNQSMNMTIWLISNWFSVQERVCVDIERLVPLLVRILIENSDTKLNAIVVYNLTNMCQYSAVRMMLMDLDVVPILYRKTNIFTNKETDISMLISNLVYHLPYDYPLSEQCADILIDFIKNSVHKTSENHQLRQDCLYIAFKLLIANNGDYHARTVKNLALCLMQWIEMLGNVTDIEHAEEFLMVIEKIYSIRTYNDYECALFQEQTHERLWVSLKELINSKGLDENVSRRVWGVLNEWTKIKGSGVVAGALKTLFDWCVKGIVEENEQRAVEILACSYMIKQPAVMDFWTLKLKEYQAYERTTLLLLQRIHDSIFSQTNPQYIREEDPLYEILNDLRNDEERTEVAELARKILKLAPTKTFDEISEVLTQPFTPVQQPSYEKSQEVTKK